MMEYRVTYDLNGGPKRHTISCGDNETLAKIMYAHAKRAKENPVWESRTVTPWGVVK